MKSAPCPCACCEKRRQRIRLQRKQRPAQGLCRMCDQQPEPGRSMCRAHLVRGVEAAKRLRERRKELGVCPDCGQAFEELTLRCRPCMDKANARLRRSYHNAMLARRREAAFKAEYRPLQNGEDRVPRDVVNTIYREAPVAALESKQNTRKSAPRTSPSRKLCGNSRSTAPDPVQAVRMNARARG